MDQRRAFQPFPLLGGPHVQTIIASQIHLTAEPPSTTEVASLPDGDRLALEVSTPSNWQPTHPTVLLIHGLCGCHGSPYMVRIARKLWQRGLRAVRMNMRGCGSGHGLARRPYHSGRSEDAHAVLDHLRHASPQSPVVAVGFSLGANLLLKLVGELQGEAADFVTHIIAVSPPADLAKSIQTFDRPSNWLYARRFERLLKRSVQARHNHFADLPPVSLPNRFTLYEFDNFYTAPQCGFRDAEDYYAQCSSAPLMPRIAVPCQILVAADDPLIDATTFDNMTLPPNVQVLKTSRGGHLGFLGNPSQPSGFRWLDSQILDWVDTALAASTAQQRSNSH